MGKTIRKQMKGMSWMAKVSMVLMITLLTSVFMYEGMYKPKGAEAAIAPLAAWSSVYRGAAYPASYSYTVPAGDKRMLVVGVTSTTSAAITQTISVSYNGVAMTAAPNNDNGANVTHSYLFYQNQGTSASSTVANIVVTMSGGTSSYNYIYAATYSGVDQSASPIRNSQGFNSSASTTAVGPFTTALTASTGDMAVEMINLTRTGSSSSSSARTISTWATGWSSALGPNSVGLTTTPNYAISSYAATNSALTNLTSQHTASSSSSFLRSMVAMSIKAFSGPTVTLANPDNGAPGATLDVTITGANFVSGATANFGGGITVNNTTFNSPTSLTANISIESIAALGVRTVTVTNPDLTTGSADVFAVLSASTPTISTVSPAALGQGATNVDVTIIGTNFVAGSVITDGTGVTVNSTTYVSPTQLTANITVPGSTTTGARNLTVTNPDTSFSTKSGALTINARPTITSTTPASQALGYTGNVTVTGTGFVNGAAANFGSGITVNSTTYVSATSLTANITIGTGAVTGARTVSVTNPDFGNNVSATNVFAVYDPAAAPTITSISPVALAAGLTSVPFTVNGTNFATGATVTVSGTLVTVAVSSVTPTQITGTITATTAATTGVRNITVTNLDTQTVTGTGLLTVTARPAATFASPVSGVQGATNLNVTITGSGFVAGAPLAAVFSNTGITVNSTTFVDATHIIANVNIAAAATGTSTITVTNGDGNTTAASGTIFQVTTASAVAITSITPRTYSQGATGVLMDIYGANFVSGATVTFSSSRFVVASSLTQTGPTTFVDAGHLQVLVNITTSSAASSNVMITNPDATTYTATAAVASVTRPTITSVSPSAGLAGNAFDLTFTGTGFQIGATVTVTTGSGITVSNVVVASATSITAHIAVDSAATLGVQTIAITNPDNGFNTATFNVTSLTAPTLTSMTPASIGLGATNLNVDLYGTNFNSGIILTSLSFGTNVTVNSATFVDATHLQANITVSTSATAGARNVTVTNPNNEAAIGSVLTLTARPGTATLAPANGSLGSTFPMTITTSALIAGPGFGISIPGGGVTVDTVTLVSATSATANVTIDPSYIVAPLGARTLTITNGDYGTRTATFTVRGAVPTATTVSPSLRQGAVAQTVTITGTNFYPGATVAFSNTGVTGGTVTVVDQNTITLPVTVSAAATTGTSNITVTNSDTQTATGTGIFTVTAGPTVISNSPVSGGQGATLDVTINGTVFDTGAVVAFSDAGITVNSVTGSGSSLTANITIAPAAFLTTRTITVTNPDGSNASGGAFEVKQPTSTTTGALSFYQVTADSITVKASYSNDGDNAGTCEIKYGTAPGVFTTTATAVRSGSAFVATLTGLAGGSDGEGKQYFFQATFSNPVGVTGTNPLVGSQSTAGNKLTHNNLNTASGKWSAGWGVAEGKYGAITCTTCHSKTSANSKLVAGTITTPSGTWDSNGSNSLAVIYNSTTPLGSDDNHASSTKACEACHTKTSHHKYNNTAANHEGTVDCLTCHSHKEAFVPNCSVCHSSQQGARRVVTGPTGDFSAGKAAAHGTLTGSNSQACATCHDSAAHKTGTSVGLKNADTGESVAYDGTAATASALKNACIACHDSNGASKLSTNALSPFAAAGDKKSPTNVDQYWPATGGAHDTKMVCLNCHGNSAGATTALKYNAHVSATPKLLQDAGYDVVNPNTYCYNCHNAASTDPNKSSKDIAGELAKTSRHTTAKCFDCHGDEANSTDSMHALRAGSQSAGSGLIANNISNATGKKMTWSATNWGGATASVNLASNTATAEYQICFKCHAATGTGTTPAVPGAGTAAASLTNLALEFNPNNASRHPVGTALVASNQLTAAKLTGGWAPGQVMTCSDCHATDTAASKGPHGSAVKWMLAGANKAWPYTTTAGNGSGSGTFVTLATYNANIGTADGLFCLNCHTIRPASGGNNWHTNANVVSSRHSGSQTIAACAACHVRVPHGGKISRLLQTTNVPNRYKANGSSTTSSFTHWGSNTVNIKGSTMVDTNFGSSCSEHSGSGGEVW